MDARNRMADVIKLRCNICQDFLKMVIMPGWQKFVYEKAKDQVQNNLSYKSKYINLYKEMRDSGIENYTIDDMDVTFINEMIIGCSNFAPVEKCIKFAMKDIVNDRNFKDHSDENEEDEELYLEGLLALCNLRKFVRLVDEKELSIEDNKRFEFRKKYIKKINDLMSTLDNERIVLVQRQKEFNNHINTILESKNPNDSWMRIYKLYTDRYIIKEIDIETMGMFFIEASNAGIKEAHIYAATHLNMKKGDYEEFEKHLLKAYHVCDKYNDKGKLHAIISEINQFLEHNGHITEQMRQIVEEIIEFGHTVNRTESGKYVWVK